MFRTLQITFVVYSIYISSLALSACDDGSSGQPCHMDCGDHGSCVILSGAENCLCQDGWRGEVCDSCAEGYVLRGTDCVLPGPDPCKPNPCSQPYKTTCTSDGQDAVCICDDNAQDKDADGICMPSCNLISSYYPNQACDDSSGLAILQGNRSCTTLLRFDPAGETFSDLFIRGEFNQWDLSTQLHEDEGEWKVTLDIAPGDYAYKFFTSGSAGWFEDPANLFFKWVDGQRNSRLKVPDCNKPMLLLLHEPIPSASGTLLDIQYLDGAGGNGLDPDSIVVQRDGNSVRYHLNPDSGVITVSEEGLSHGKYLYSFTAVDIVGNATNTLYVPVWVENEKFDWRGAVMYFAFTDRFYNGNESNDRPVPGVDTKANWNGGDFDGIRKKIESGYFDQLGVDVIWLSSISENTDGAYVGASNRLYSAYHSYWPVSTGWSFSNPIPGKHAVEPHFGTKEELKQLIRIAHAHGIRIVVDLVLNHVHEDSPLWTEHSQDNPPWFHLPAQDCKETNWTKPITCWFAPNLPDLDYTNTAVMDTMMEYAKWLVEEFNIDGFRVDAVKHMVDDVVFSLRGSMDQVLRFTGLRFYMVGETFTGEDGADLLKHYIGRSGLDGQFDFPLYWQITSVFLRQERDLKSLAHMVEQNDSRYGLSAVMSNFLGNHDVCRALSQANGDIGDMWCNGGKEQGWTKPPQQPLDQEPYSRLALAWTFLMTSPGIPLIYYGDEIGMAGAGDPDNRRPMVFGDDLNEPQKALLSLVGKLGNFRHSHPALWLGNRTELLLADDGNLWVYAMTYNEDKVVVVLNRSVQERSLSIPMDKIDVDDGSNLHDELGSGSWQVTGAKVKLDIAAMSAMVLSVD